MSNVDHEHEDALEHRFEEELTPVRAVDERLQLYHLYPIKLDITAELGKKTMLVRDVLDLAVDSVLVLDKQAGEMAELAVNGIPFARGEIVVHGDTLHVRIAQVLGAEEQEEG